MGPQEDEEPQLKYQRLGARCEDRPDTGQPQTSRVAHLFAGGGGSVAEILKERAATCMVVTSKVCGHY